MSDLQERARERRRRARERLVRFGEEERPFDLRFWQGQDPNARFEAAWEMVVEARRMRGQEPSEPRLQRSVEHLQRFPG